MVEAKLLEHQVTYWKEAIGGLVLISPENQTGRVDLLTYNQSSSGQRSSTVKSTVCAKVRSQQYPSLQGQVRCRAHLTEQDSPSLPHTELFPFSAEEPSGVLLPSQGVLLESRTEKITQGCRLTWLHGALTDNQVLP